MITCSHLLLFLLVSFELKAALSRHWTDVNTWHELIPQDSTFSAVELTMEVDIGSEFTPTPTASPTDRTSTPTAFPTETPEPSSTISPSDRPTDLPTNLPTLSPSTTLPTSFPTATRQPTTSPTLAPTDGPFAGNPPPEDADESYFDYSPNSGYGPEQWKDTWSAPPEEKYYWTEFTNEGFGLWRGILDERDLRRNRCGSGLQSPINVVRTCSEDGSCISCRDFGHQVLGEPGDFNISSAPLNKKILSNKLRLIYPRRRCFDEGNEECIANRPAHADFPNGWPQASDVLHVDFRPNGEHCVNGICYDAEMQIFHGHHQRKRLPTSAVVIKAIPGVHNRQLQMALDQFQLVFDQHAAECEASRRRERRRVAQAHRILKGTSIWESVVDYINWGKYSLWSEDPAKNATKRRELFSGSADWFPYHPKLAPSPFFYAYDGSMTEPPCTEIVAWRIIRRPMIVSIDQLEQMKNLVFNHVDSNCKRTGAQFSQSVARPLQPVNGRDVFQCSSNNFEADFILFPPGRGEDSYDLNLPLI